MRFLSGGLGKTRSELDISETVIESANMLSIKGFFKVTGETPGVAVLVCCVM